jgi:hypothetical protein
VRTFSVVAVLDAATRGKLLATFGRLSEAITLRLGDYQLQVSTIASAPSAVLVHQYGPEDALLMAAKRAEALLLRRCLREAA